MAISETIKLNILINKKSKDKVLDWLQEYGLMQIEAMSEVSPVFSGDNASETVDNNIDYDLAGVKFVLDFLTPYDETKVPLVEKLAGNKIKLSREEMERIGKNFDYRGMVERCRRIENKMSENKNVLEKIGQEKEYLTSWRSLKIAPGKTETEKTKTIFGTINTEKYLDFLSKLGKETKEFAIEKIHLTERESYLGITFNKIFEEKLNKIFNDFGFNKQELPYSDLLPEEAIDKISQETRVRTEKNEDLRKEAKNLTMELKYLKIAFDWLTWRKGKQESEARLGETQYIYSIMGWIEKINFKTVHNKLQKLTKNNVDIEGLKLTKKDVLEQPIVIRNKKIWRPFESVTGIYGLPKASETDPTVFLAPFFIIFFGLCLTDAGYGIMLSVLAYLAIKIMKVPRENQKLFRVLIYGGMVTFVLGALFGGWFGITLDNLPDSNIKKTLMSIQQINPIKSPLLVLGLTFALGVIQVWTGIIIAMWWQLKQKNIKEAILAHGVWVYLIPVVLFWAAGKAGILPESLLGISKVLLGVGIAVMVLTQGRSQKNIIAKIGAGVMSLYGLVGYLSDILSYSRLLALGLATGIIAMVINLIAVLFKDMIPYVGWAVAILILIGGHLFNLVINVLGAFIHSGRLQFVEFFPKFMEGGGVRFKPLRRESKYVEIINNNS